MVVAVVLLAVSVESASAQVVVSAFTEKFRSASFYWTSRLVGYAQRTFVLLAGFEVVASAAILLLKPRKLDEATGGFVVKILVMSVCFFSITSFDLLVPRVFDTFVAVGGHAAMIPTLNPAAVGGYGILIAGLIVGRAAMGPLALVPPMMTLVAVVALLVVLAFAAIAAQIVYTLIEGYVVVSAGVFFLGFASFRGTAQLADNYIMYVVHVGTKLFMLYLLIPVGMSAAVGWADQMKNVTILDLSAPFEALLGACVFCGLVVFLPGSFASRITSGASLGIAQALRSN